MTSTIYGLIDQAGNVLMAQGKFSAKKLFPGHFKLTFAKSMRKAVMVGSARKLEYCDNQNYPATFCNDQEDPKTIGVRVDSPDGSSDEELGFSFIAYVP